MKKVKGFFASIGKGIGNFFLSLFAILLRFFRQVVRIGVLPISLINRLRAKKGKDPILSKLCAWSNKGEPEDEEERSDLNRLRVYRWITLALLALLIIFLLRVFGSPIGRATSSVNYFKDGMVFIWNSWTQAPGSSTEPAQTVTIDIPAISAYAEEQFRAIVADLTSFWFYFQVFVGSLFNKDIASAWGYDFLNGLVNLLRVVDWIPVFILLVVVFKKVYAKPNYEEGVGPTAMLERFDNTFLPRIGRPIKYNISDYFSYLFHRNEWNANRYYEENSWDKVIFYGSVLFIGIIGWTILDAITSYLIMVMAFSFSWFPTFLASIIIDIIILFTKVGIPGAIVIFSYFAYKTLKAIARGKLAQMQLVNEDVAKSLPVITAINGPVGVGKTTMMSSIAIDGESMFRDYFLSVMQKYQSAFPAFPWREVEQWAIKVSTNTVNEEGRVTEKAMIHTRAQLKKSLNFLYKNWEKSGYQPLLENGSTAFFGYDPNHGLYWYDGARDVSLIEAVQSYVECYFMYYSGQRLATSNYPIAFDKNSDGYYFKVYAPASSYLSYGLKPRRMQRDYSHIFNMDFFRIKTPLNREDDSRKASIDGGVVAMTEASNERGNRFDYVGKSKGDSDANPLNDGWNKALRLVRHWFMIDGKPCCMFIYDYQRGDSMNAEARDSAEDTILIMDRSDEDNAIPLFWLIDTLCSVIENWWKNYYWYSWKPNRGKETLVNRLLSYFCGFFISLKQRVRYSYGFETVTFNREHGGMNGLTGQRTIENYYFIYKKVRSGMFKSDVYSPILQQSSLTATSGWMDMPTYKDVAAKPADFTRQNSYFINDTCDLYDAGETEKAVNRLKAKQTHGTDSPFMDQKQEETAKKEEEE